MVGRTAGSAADRLVGLVGHAQQPDEAVRRGPGGPPYGFWEPGVYTGLPTKARNSSRVALFDRNEPSIVLVMVPECCFSTPRIIMQKWRASTKTATPRGEMALSTDSAI